MSAKLPSSNESAEQISLFQWAAYSRGAFPELDLLYHIPNGGKRSITTAKRLKAEGVKAGVPDLCLPVPRGRYHGLYIEMKSGKNKPTGNQKRWLKALKSEGYYTAVCYGWDSAASVIIRYLEIREEV